MGTVETRYAQCLNEATGELVAALWRAITEEPEDGGWFIQFHTEAVVFWKERREWARKEGW